MAAPVRNHLTAGLYAVCLFAAILNAAASESLKAVVLCRMDAAIEAAIDEHRLPGAVLFLEHNGARYHKAYGLRSFEPQKEAMTEETLFDIASLTKVIATAPSIMLLVERGQIDLSAPVKKYLPEFSGTNKSQVTIRHLLTHTSGLPSTYSGSMPYDYATAIDLACREPLQKSPESFFCYSDIGFILLGEIIQRVSAESLADFARRNIFLPLKMNATCFQPGAAARKLAAPTLRSGNLSDRGEVHDHKAQRMGGIAGHAGVFSTAADLARYARMILNDGELDGARVLQPRTVRLMTSTQTAPAITERRGLGWDISSGFSRPRGKLFPVGSFGHTGFTGTSLWIDPTSNSFWILLSNRVYPDGRGNILELQSQLGTLAAEAIGNFNFSRSNRESDARERHGSAVFNAVEKDGSNRPRAVSPSVR